MISPQSIAVATAACGLVGREGELFRFTFKHSIFFTIIIGVIAMLQAYVFPGMIPAIVKVGTIGKIAATGGIAILIGTGIFVFLLGLYATMQSGGPNNKQFN